jgi:hypothetical protein
MTGENLWDPSPLPFHFDYNQAENMLIISFRRCLLGTHQDIESFISKMKVFCRSLNAKCYILVDLQDLYVKPEVGTFFWSELKRLVDPYAINILGYAGPVFDGTVGTRLGTRSYLFPIFYGRKERAIALLKEASENE